MNAVPADLIEAIADRAAELALEKLTARRPGAARPANQITEMPDRDLETELAALLEGRPGLTVPEIGQALQTRHETVRRTLKTSPRFSSRTRIAGRSPKAKGWFLAADSSPTDPGPGTSPLDPTPDGASA